MPRFAYEAVDTDGVSVSGVETAIDEHELDRKLADASLLLVKASALAKRGGRAASDRALIDFCYHLSVVVEAGIPLVQGLSDLRDQDDSVLADALADVTMRVEGGSTLSDALAERPREFPGLVRSLVRAGESTGQLDKILADLVRYLEWRDDLRRQLKTAATYPAIVITGVIALCLVVTLYVLPAFLDIFADLGVELPLTTRALIAIQLVLTEHWLALIVSAAVLAISAVTFGRTETGRNVFHTAQLRIPLIGRLVLMIEASRFSHNLGVLYASGLPIMTGLEMVRDIVQNRRVVDVVDDVRDRVSRGETLSDALARHKIMPTIVLRMVAIGEASGRLDEALERVSKFYDREVPEIIARALALFNLGALLFLGAALVVIGISLFVPLYTMMGNLNAS